MHTDEHALPHGLKKLVLQQPYRTWPFHTVITRPVWWLPGYRAAIGDNGGMRDVF